MISNLKISVISPVYKGENIVDKLCVELIKSLKQITDDFEIILVDDCSTDNSWFKIQKNAKIYNEIKGIKLSKNFGQHNAITAGLEHCSGEWIVVMDCDLQDRPEEIINLYNNKEGFDLVVAKRTYRKHSFVKRFYSYTFYRIFSYLTDTNQNDSIANFGIYNRKVINAIISLKERTKAFSIMSKWVGFRRLELDVKHDLRYEGKSSYTLKKLLKLSFALMISFSNKPLKLSIFIGIIIILSTALLSLYFLKLYFYGGIEVPGYTSIILSIWFFSGIIISLIGITGLYIGEMFLQVKERPLYIIDETTNQDFEN